MASVKKFLRNRTPAPIISAYHLTLALAGALAYGFPSRKLLVVAVTGTKGKSSVTEMLNAIFEEAHYETALLNSIRVKTAEGSSPNSIGRSMPGRFFIQRFLARAVNAACDIAIIEMTSEGARQHRHRAIALDCLVFINLAPEHIESHGSYEAYADAKFELARGLVRSSKRPRIIVANANDAQGARYLSIPVEAHIPFSLENATPYEATSGGGYFTFDGVRVSVPFPGEFSLLNALAAASAAKALRIDAETIARGLSKLTRIPGRADIVDAGQDFRIVVDYAHTPDSLEALLKAYAGLRRICILGSAGGGRDTWKRPVMGKIAEKQCEHVIVTNDDPYDDDPQKIADEIVAGMEKRPEVILDRRDAIARAIAIAKAGDVVLITGKGIDAIYGPGGKKIPWNDAQVAYEEVKKRLGTAV